MYDRIARGGRKALGILGRILPTTAELKARHAAAFAVLDSQVQIAKRSPTAHVAVGTGMASLLITGHFGPALGLAGVWLGSRPLTHVAAGSLACVGALDAALAKAASQLQRKAQAGKKSRAPRRRRQAKVEPQLAAAPVGA